MSDSSRYDRGSLLDLFFFLLRLLVFPIMLAVCMLVCMLAVPLDLIFQVLKVCGWHIIIIVSRLIGLPLVIIWAAWFNRASWDRYLAGWAKAHESVRADWTRSFRESRDLFVGQVTWLVKGPKGTSGG